MSPLSTQQSVFMYRKIRAQLQPFCTVTDCNRSCLCVHRQRQQMSSASGSSTDFELKASSSRLRRGNHLLIREIETESMINSNNNTPVCSTSASTTKRVKTLEEIIELARRKASRDYGEEVSLHRQHIVGAREKLPVEEPAVQSLELVGDNEWFSSDWAHLQELLESDEERISPSSEAPMFIDIDEDAQINTPLHLVPFITSCQSNHLIRTVGIGKFY
ncbi:unnamed protein product [Thelazia callipaeda]|uniref:Uncharacterized protein n=1 Tax=Thelazia callipaeda TaxID=103827 RepID=A0A0N5CXJ6_THECL|nr:unnamed protein product [Thelazia callipaeda]